MGPEDTLPVPGGRREADRPTFYALRTGGWRDYWTLLHPPYTAWHLSYVVFGAAVAREVDGRRLGATVLAFFLGVGISAHALDELRGRPLRTRIPDPVLWSMAAVALAGAVALGIFGALEVSLWLLAFAMLTREVGARALRWAWMPIAVAVLLAGSG